MSKVYNEYKKKEARDATILPTLSVNFTCPVLNKNIEKTEIISRYACDNECDCCGSHGYIEITVKCECKDKEHDIILSEW